ncbi:hypothetical protein ACQUW5_15165 [Legionella sp. CNM-1927-20]|uniref:hypothetical protein n=1 Tax=Legionella sp. CNM-1927-20 TaxID=3422221 RepID=UPI00403A8BCC
MSALLNENEIITGLIDKLYTSCMEARNRGLQIFEAKEYDDKKLRNCLNNKENIFEVDNQFKSNYFVKRALQPKDIRMLVGSYHEQIASIKITDTCGHIPYVIGQADFIATFALKDGQKLHFLVKGGFDDQIKQLINKLPEENLEVVSKKCKRTSKQPKSPQFWAEDWEEETVAKSHYDKISDDFMKQRFEDNVLPLAKGKEKLIIMDIGGGKGRLASKLIDILIKHQVPFKYILIEPASSQCETATKQFQERYPEKMHSGDIEVINLTLADFSTSEEYANYCGEVDAIILSGGPINEEIVWMNEAQENFSRIQPLLSENGLIIAAGLSPLHFTRKDFTEKYGLEVVGTVKRNPAQSSYQRDELHQCYVIKNSPNHALEASADTKKGMMT